MQNTLAHDYKKGENMIVQVAALLFVLFAWSRALLRYKDNKIGMAGVVFWSIIWIGVLLLAFAPGLFAQFGEFVGVQRPVDVAVYTCLIVLLYLVFRLYVKQETGEVELTRLVRRIALQSPKKKVESQSK